MRPFFFLLFNLKKKKKSYLGLNCVKRYVEFVDLYVLIFLDSFVRVCVCAGCRNFCGSFSFYIHKILIGFLLSTGQ